MSQAAPPKESYGLPELAIDAMLFLRCATFRDNINADLSAVFLAEGVA